MAGEGVSFRSFVSETELDEKRKQRQEEWEKVRTADQPLECPEEEVDPRSLYEKLQEQKDKKQSDFEEQFKFKNMVRGIDEDESKFLDEVADRQMEIETKRWREEKDMLEEMKEYTERVVPAAEPNVKLTNKTQPTEKTTPAKTMGASSTRRTQASLLAGAVKRKRSESDDKSGEKKGKSAASTSESSTSRNGADSLHGISNESQSTGINHTTVNETAERTLVDDGDRAQVVRILPGLGFYSNSSDSDTSSSDSEVDLLNSVIRRPTKKKGKASCH
ncbi:PSME3-interacting protein-like [Patiria miniata]|uniref:FAM192A/Fyv6 N-terminal domain-containing protein n=1 Tax=Patiria miniata TaxID=46514 RepID=A0A914B317_PATMI|nr:PSME3-interacting protein-like [Patiria miniata]